MKTTNVLAATFLTASSGPVWLILTLGDGIARQVLLMARAIKRDHDRRRTLNTLAALEDHVLRDIGVRRGDVGPRPQPWPFRGW